ncbi:MAG: hypothetical protein EXR01_02845 [Acetobacteraceae bacterium]|nr:hypothetical protein [Acetobacteraceae bacterium]
MADATVLCARLPLCPHGADGADRAQPGCQGAARGDDVAGHATSLPFNPVGRVPSLRLDDGTVLTETLLILPFLDRLY